MRITTDIDPNHARHCGGTGRRVLLGSVAATAVFAAPQSRAQPGWAPTRPIRLIVPFAPGGGGDVVARLLANTIGNRMGQPMVVENRAGAGGAIGSEYVFNAPPDGYTLQMATVDSHSIHPQVYAVRFRATDFTAVAPVVKISFALAGRPGLTAATLPELMALARSRELTYGMWGVGSSSHVAMSMFRAAASLPPMLPVPYQGAGPALQALLAGQVDLVPLPTPLAVAQRGNVILYGILSPSRNAALPDVPTMGEQGIAIDTDAWIGLLAPPNLPAPIVETISRHVAEAVAEPAFLRRLGELGMDPHRASAAEFAAYLDAEYARWGQTIREAGIKAE